MRSITLTIAITCLPALLGAQQVSASASASGQANVSVPASYSTQAKTKIESAFQAARSKGLPEQPMRQRMAEGQAKGASDAQVAVAVQKVEARLEASQSAMIRAGRTHPQPDEVTGGEQVMERGATEAQVEALVKHAPSDRSLTVAFNVLSRLEARGEPVDQAVAEIQSKLDARASDEALVSLASGADATMGGGNGTNAHGAASGTANAAAGSTASAAGNAAAGVGAAAKGAGGVTGAVSGTVTGALGGKKP